MGAFDRGDDLNGPLFPAPHWSFGPGHSLEPVEVGLQGAVGTRDAEPALGSDLEVVTRKVIRHASAALEPSCAVRTQVLA